MAVGLSEADLVQFAAGLFEDAGLDGQLQQRLINEARFGLSRVLPVLETLEGDSHRVLEVGAGTCILSAYLAGRGLTVTAVEPLGPEFDFFTDLQARVVAFCRAKGIALELVRKSGEQVDLLGRFDLAFTINALEHMREPLRTIDNMYRALAPGGVLLAHCPNYTVPLDTHFNIMLVTRSKAINAWLYRSKIRKYPSVWDELNFIRYGDMRRHLRRQGARFAFNTSVLRDAMRRLLDDPIFAARMPMPVRAVGGILRYTGLVEAMRLLPARLQTPMEVLVWKP